MEKQPTQEERAEIQEEKNMTATLLLGMDKEDAEFIEGMRQYINKLRSLSPECAKKEAQEALIRTGVLDEHGNPKKNIVSWE